VLIDLIDEIFIRDRVGLKKAGDAGLDPKLDGIAG